MFKSLVIAAAALMTICANTAFADFEEGKHALLVNFGYTRGGMGLGLDYENGIHRTFGVGGYFRMYPDNDDPAAAGITAIGAFIRPHFNRQAWDFYVSPGFGMISYEPAGNGNDETLLGPSFALGLLYEFTSAISFGVEQMSLYNWFGEEDYRGNVSYDELMAKFRFIF
jgi:hypothetical protein